MKRLIGSNGLEVSIVLFVALIPFGKLFWIPVFFAFLGGFFDFIKRRRLGLINNKEYAYFSVFLLFWIPALISVPQAYDVGRAVKFCFVYMALFMAGYYVLNRASTERLRNILIPLTVIVFIWVAAATVQMISSGVFFGESVGGRYQGLFGDNMIMGYSLIPLVGLLVYGWAEKSKKIAFAFLVFMIWGGLISGNRAAWVSFIVLLAVFFLVSWVRNRQVSLISFRLLIPGFVVFFGLCLFVVAYTDVGKRMQHTFAFVSNPNIESLNASSAGRIEVWRTAISMAIDNIWTGVGARSFRYAFPDYAPESKFVTEAFDGSGFDYQGALYAHQIVLQIFADTGISGLVGVILFYLMVCFLFIKKIRVVSLIGAGFCASYLAMVFPFNTHLNFYSNFFGAYFWLMTAIFVSILFEPKRELEK